MQVPPFPPVPPYSHHNPPSLFPYISSLVFPPHSSQHPCTTDPCAHSAFINGRAPLRLSPCAVFCSMYVYVNRRNGSMYVVYSIEETAPCSQCGTDGCPTGSRHSNSSLGEGSAHWKGWGNDTVGVRGRRIGDIIPLLFLRRRERGGIRHTRGKCV
ncbi:unnamed protein product [Timema podura]|uniref:Uncharacterized protein n=1 Tax=Timema podura TaxID=61482 RepID=A0ABN7NV91_TIMPD|nr:unnamed protein product [Timema podura]